jgi:hypothetical protein
MPDPHIREFRLAGPQGDGLHAYLNDEGAFIGFGTPLVEKDHSGAWRPRPLAELDTMLKIGYDDPVPVQRRMGNLAAVARALNKGDRALAAILLVHAEFPPLPDRFAAERMIKAYLLDKDYNPDQPRVPAGNSDGGRWTSGGESEDSDSAPKQKTAMDAGCLAEWQHAQAVCGALDARGLLGTLGYLGFGRTLSQCVRGMVSARCGGNPI